MAGRVTREESSDPTQKQKIKAQSPEACHYKKKMSLTPKIFYYSLHQPLTQVLPFSGSQLSHWRNERPELNQLRLVTFLSYIRPPSIS